MLLFWYNMVWALTWILQHRHFLALPLIRELLRSAVTGAANLRWRDVIQYLFNLSLTCDRNVNNGGEVASSHCWHAHARRPLFTVSRTRRFEFRSIRLFSCGSAVCTHSSPWTPRVYTHCGALLWLYMEKKGKGGEKKATRRVRRKPFSPW